MVCSQHCCSHDLCGHVMDVSYLFYDLLWMMPCQHGLTRMVYWAGLGYAYCVNQNHGLLISRSHDVVCSQHCCSHDLCVHVMDVSYLFYDLLWMMPCQHGLTRMVYWAGLGYAYCVSQNHSLLISRSHDVVCSQHCCSHDLCGHVMDVSYLFYDLLWMMPCQHGLTRMVYLVCEVTQTYDLPHSNAAF